MALEWESLLSLKRFGDTHKRLRKEQDRLRLGFEVDYDRIVFSNAFRSLQDKTQVIPFSKKDFVHTRLTHSLEVSVVGRSLGRMVGKGILEKHPHLEQTLGYEANDFGAIVGSACLAHDIGNPPFGHSGEKAIGYFFTRGEGTGCKAKLDADTYQDLCDFEGNANGFRILTASREGMPGGLRLSYGTLGAFVKYPKKSLPVKPSSHVADKKYGYFHTEEDFFKELAGELKTANGKHYHRHPLTYLVEAADDICYTIIDFEDGINLGWIDEAYALEYLINLVKDSIDRKKYAELQYKPQRLSYLRALAINSLIADATAVFLENEATILAGDFSTSLLEKSKYKAQIEDIIAVSIQKIYRAPEVIDKEVVGYRTLNILLEAFVWASIHKFEGRSNSYDRLLLSLVPEGTPMQAPTLYETILNATCFVASLSDGKALQMAQQIGG